MWESSNILIMKSLLFKLMKCFRCFVVLLFVGAGNVFSHCALMMFKKAALPSNGGLEIPTGCKGERNVISDDLYVLTPLQASKENKVLENHRSHW